MLMPQAVEAPRPAGAPFTVLIREDFQPVPLQSDVHQGFEICLVTQGRLERHFPGLVRELQPGDVCLCAAWEPHGWRSLEAGTSIVNIHFLSEFVGDAKFDGTSWLSLFACRPKDRPWVDSDAVRREMLAIADDLCRGKPDHGWRDRRAVRTADGVKRTTVATVYEVLAGGKGVPPAWEEGIRLNILRILLILYRIWGYRQQAASRPAAHTSHLAQIMPAVRLTIDESLRGHRVTLPQAADACHLSVTYFRNLFKRNMGLTFGRFEIRQRLALAEGLLLTSDLSMEDIAERAGFVDGSHLNRTFLKHYHKTPTAHRAEGRELR